MGFVRGQETIVGILQLLCQLHAAEGVPQMGRLLAVHHQGFAIHGCTVSLT